MTAELAALLFLVSSLSWAGSTKETTPPAPMPGASPVSAPRAPGPSLGGPTSPRLSAPSSLRPASAVSASPSAAAPLEGQASPEAEIAQGVAEGPARARAASLNSTAREIREARLEEAASGRASGSIQHALDRLFESKVKRSGAPAGPKSQALPDVAGKHQKAEEKIRQTAELAQSAALAEVPALYQAAIETARQSLAAEAAGAVGRVLRAFAADKAESDLPKLLHQAKAAARDGSPQAVDQAFKPLSRWDELLSDGGRPGIADLPRLRDGLAKASRAAAGAVVPAGKTPGAEFLAEEASIRRIPGRASFEVMFKPMPARPLAADIAQKMAMPEPEPVLSDEELLRAFRDDPTPANGFRLMYRDQRALGNAIPGSFAAASRYWLKAPGSLGYKLRDARAHLFIRKAPSAAKPAVSRPQTPIILPGVTTSAGSGVPVIGPLSFDPAKAARSGLLLAGSRLDLDRQTARRLRGIVLTAGSFADPVCALARELGIPVIILDGAGPKLEEGAAARLDALQARLEVFASEERPGRLEAAEALAAYEGLKDARALALWFEARLDADKKALGPLLVEEVAARVAAGRSPAADLAAIVEAVAKAVPAPSLAALKSSLWKRQRRRDLALIEAAPMAIQAAASYAAVEALLADARGRKANLEALAQGLAVGSEAAPARVAVERAEKLAAAKRESLPKEEPELGEVLASHGAALPERRRLPESAYRRFLEESGLAGRVKDIAEDPGQSVARRADRVRALLLKAEIEDGSALGRELDSLVPASWTEFDVTGPGGAGPASRAGLRAAVKDRWAALWTASRLAEFRREGRDLTEEETRFTLQERRASDASGSALTHSPGTGRRAFQAYAAPGSRTLTAAESERLSGAAAALERALGRPLEIRYSFSAGKLVVLRVLPL